MFTITPFKQNTVAAKTNANKHLQYHSQSGVFPMQNDTFTKTASLTAPTIDETGISWLKDKTILKALKELETLTFDKEDVDYIQSLGAVPPFKSGIETLNSINNSNVRIKFDALPSPKVHAQYDYETNFIKINEIYKNTQNPAEILAITEAIMHESGHAKDKNGTGSIQEEIDCLALNALSHRALSKKHPGIFKSTDSLIVKDGVCIYSDLFFDKDSLKTKLVARIGEKYGFLPAGDFTHPPSNLAIKIKNTQV